MEELHYENTERDRIIFHFNKKHNEDTSIPPWVIKTVGKTFYVHHFESLVGFKTKETPDNPATKGSIYMKGRIKITKKNDIFSALIK